MVAWKVEDDDDYDHRCAALLLFAANDFSVFGITWLYFSIESIHSPNISYVCAIFFLCLGVSLYSTIQAGIVLHIRIDLQIMCF